MTQNVENKVRGNVEIVAKSKVRTSLVVFLPKKDEEHLGAFASRNDPDKHYARLTVSNPQPDGNGGFDSKYGQMICFGELVHQLGQFLNGAPNGNNITIVAHANLEIQRAWGKVGTQHEGKEFFNQVYQVYGFAYGDNFYTTKAGVLTVTPYEDTRPVVETLASRKLPVFGSRHAVTPPITQPEDDAEWLAAERAKLNQNPANKPASRKAKPATS